MCGYDPAGRAPHPSGDGSTVFDDELVKIGRFSAGNVPFLTTSEGAPIERSRTRPMPLHKQHTCARVTQFPEKYASQQHTCAVMTSPAERPCTATRTGVRHQSSGRSGASTVSVNFLWTPRASHSCAVSSTVFDRSVSKIFSICSAIAGSMNSTLIS